MTATRRENKAGTRLDYELTPKLRFSGRANFWSNDLPQGGTGGGAITTPASLSSTKRDMKQAYGIITQVLSNRALNEVRIGYAKFHYTIQPLGSRTEFSNQRIRIWRSAHHHFAWFDNRTRDDAPARLQPERHIGTR